MKIDWSTRHLNWTWVIAIFVLLSVTMSCGAPTTVVDNQSANVQLPIKVSRIYSTDNATYYALDGAIEYGKSGLNPWNWTDEVRNTGRIKTG